MDNAQKAIMIGVGLFITIIVIAAVMLITGMGQDLLNSGTNQLGSITNGMDSALYEQLVTTNGQVLSKTATRQHAKQYVALEGVSLYLKDKNNKMEKIENADIDTKLSKSTYKISVKEENGAYTVTYE